MKKVICDLCKTVLTKEVGIRRIEIDKINNSSFEKYPDNYDASGLINYDICLKCFLKIEREINRIKKLKGEYK